MSRQRRVLLSEPVPAIFAAGSARGRGKIHDVSRGGFFVRSPTLLSNGAHIEAAIVIPSGRRIPVEGIVCWNTAGLNTRWKTSGFGVRVTYADVDYQGFVEGALAAAETPEL